MTLSLLLPSILTSSSPCSHLPANGHNRRRKSGTSPVIEAHTLHPTPYTLRPIRLGALLALLAFSLTLAGCTTGRRGGVGGSAASASTASSTLRIPMTAEPTTLDPAKIPDVVTYELLENCFEGLVRFNEKNEIEPCLAERWEISPDRTTYTFHLRNGVTFHNGRAFVADDVKYSWERALAPQTRSPVAANYLDGILGVADVVHGKRKDLPGVQVVDAHTLRVHIDRPRAYFLGMLSYPTGWVVCREAVEKNGGVVDEKALIGTGPFELESYQPGHQITLKANPNYWGGKPGVERIEAPIIINPETLYNNFTTGQLDLLPGVPNSRYAQDRDAGKFTAEYKVVPTAQVDYLVMHPGVQPAFAKKDVRLAFALAIDRNQILKVAYKNVGHVADGIVPPELPDGGPSPPPIPYDPARARQLLAQAGYPGGRGFPTLTLSIPEQSPVASETGQIIRANLRDNLGITVNLQERESGQLIDEAIRETMEFYLAGWVADYPDPQDFLSTLFASHASLNHVQYHNARFDALCTQADAEPNTQKRAAFYGQANRILVTDDVGVLPLAFVPRILLIHPNVQGWHINLCTFLPNTHTTKTGSGG